MAWVVSQLQMTSGCLRGNHPRPCPVTPDTPRGSSPASLSMYFQTVISSKSTCLPLILLICLFWLCWAFLVTWASRYRAGPSAAAARGLSGRGSPAVAQGLSCFLAGGIFSGQGSPAGGLFSAEPPGRLPLLSLWSICLSHRHARAHSYGALQTMRFISTSDWISLSDGAFSPLYRGEN